MRFVKYFVTAIAAIAFVASANAQGNRKPVLGIENFSYTNHFSPADVEFFRNKLIGGIQKTGRVVVVDFNATTSGEVPSTSLLTASLDQLQIKGEVYEDKETRKEGDKYKTIVKGRYPYLKATLNYSIKIIDCKTGSVLGQETFTITSGSFDSYKHQPDYYTYEAAHKGIMEKCINQDDLAVFILNTFKVEGRILQVDKKNAKKAKSVYLDLGSNDGVKKGQIFEVFEEVDVAGETSWRQIGEVEISEVTGPSRSLASVRTGGESILLLLPEKGTLPVRTRKVAAKLFGGVK